MTLVNPAVETAKCLKQLLTGNDLLSGSGEVPEHTFYVSDSAEKFRSLANSILPCNVIETKDVAIKTFE